ncbi:hypothetical protein M069_1327 [Bacteroides fragilis str. B1 (UDC16-1)]|nr:hypothetical protein M069_1327 [Bacteroides fragilis str. B1 (UDC16-1)]
MFIDNPRWYLGRTRPPFCISVKFSTHSHKHGSPVNSA